MSYIQTRSPWKTRHTFEQNEALIANQQNHLEIGLIDTSATAEDLVQKGQISAEKNNRFKGGSEQVDLNVL